ncbi:DUF4270 domain-containing protein [Hymenobacter sp. BT728]|nr:DUF4270 domain-containing protein [Hymenobacter pini]
MCLLGLVTGCEKANDLGLELPGTSPITANYLDLPVSASTVRQQPIETIKADHVLVGRLRDMYVGTTTAAAYLNMQVLPSSLTNDTIPATFTAQRLDSAVLFVPFDRVYGTASQPLQYDLQTLAQPLDERTVYTSTSTGATGTTLLTNQLAPLNRYRTVKQRVASGNSTDTTTTVITTSIPDQVLRIRMLRNSSTATLANQVFNALKDGTPTQSKLDAVLSGFAIKPSASHQGNIVGFNAGSNASIIFYYTGTTTSGTVTKVRPHFYRVWFAHSNSSTPGKYFTQLSTDLSGTPFAGLTTTQSQLPAVASGGYTYAQGGTGLATRIEFQGLDNLRNNTDISINRAELLLPVKQNSNGLFPYPGGLYLYEANSQNEILTRTVGATTYDRLVPAEGAVGSVRLTPTSAGPGTAAQAVTPTGQDPIQYYAVPLTEYLQAYLQNRLDGELPSGLLLSPTLRSNLTLNLNRAQLDANNIKLRVYYSKLR